MEKAKIVIQKPSLNRDPFFFLSFLLIEVFFYLIKAESFKLSDHGTEVEPAERIIYTNCIRLARLFANPPCKHEIYTVTDKTVDLAYYRLYCNFLGILRVGP